MKTISVRLSKTLDAKLASTAKKQSTTKSEIVSAALKQYLQRHAEPAPKSVAARAKKLVGSVYGGPPDLSYNKKHMDGFGRD